MTTIGLCTHFSETDAWAFDYALRLVQSHEWQLNICHWLYSPYKIRRDMIPDDLFDHSRISQATPQLLNKLELQLREYYDPQLGDFTDVAFKLCEGQYQVELVRCFRQHLLDLVVMGHQPAREEGSLEDFSANLKHPLVIVGKDGPNSFLLNEHALAWLDTLELPEGSWSLLERMPVGNIP